MKPHLNKKTILIKISNAAIVEWYSWICIAPKYNGFLLLPDSSFHLCYTVKSWPKHSCYTVYRQTSNTISTASPAKVNMRHYACIKCSVSNATVAHRCRFAFLGCFSSTFNLSVSHQLIITFTVYSFCHSYLELCHVHCPPVVCYLLSDEEPFL